MPHPPSTRGLISTALLALVLTGCSDDQQTKQIDPSIAAGEALFVENCSKCHPRTGRGDYLKRIPATLLTMKSADELKTWIRGADQHREMPSFEEMSEEELSNLASFLHNEITK